MSYIGPWGHKELDTTERPSLLLSPLCAFGASVSSSVKWGSWLCPPQRDVRIKHEDACDMPVEAG